MKKIDWSKPVRVKDLLYPVRVICKDRKRYDKKQSVLCLVDSDHTEEICSYMLDGESIDNSYPLENYTPESVEWQVVATTYPTGLHLWMSSPVLDVHKEVNRIHRETTAVIIGVFKRTWTDDPSKKTTQFIPIDQLNG